MTKENDRLTPEDALARVERDRAIDGFFARLARGESPAFSELDVNYLKQILVDAGADLETPDLVEAKANLAKTKYTEAHPNRRPGLIYVWEAAPKEGVEVGEVDNGEGPVARYEDWAQKLSASTCPRFKNDKKEPIEGSQSRGLKQLLADLTEMAIGGGMTVEDFVRRTDVRVRRGLARKNKTEMPESDLAMIPPGSLEDFWNAVRSGGLPH